MESKLIKVNLPTEKKYVILAEASYNDGETWYNFIKLNNNEENLTSLKEQINTINDWSGAGPEDLHAFVYDDAIQLSESTVDEMIRVDLNFVHPHRKFDGELKFVNLELEKSSSDLGKIKRLNKKLRDGKIKNYIDEECVPSDREFFSSDDDDVNMESVKKIKN